MGSGSWPDSCEYFVSIEVEKTDNCTNASTSSAERALTSTPASSRGGGVSSKWGQQDSSPNVRGRLLLIKVLDLIFDGDIVLVQTKRIVCPFL